ncbi:hypothetical protein [Roseivivax sediminis]|uniref:Uncharacterized protein n=1 Tax=Roseivivax sediminis TaxID=936889 RepID=A0A1I2A6Y3_9RHOB|nr:hypothetical protein [Roseivivax sediminis]SFE39318.1 hypothetical protein SAMN04515678_109104 [Roseivivax sediminis]
MITASPRTLSAAALLSLFAAVPATAGETVLVSSGDGATLTEYGVAVSVYWTETDDAAAEVVATYKPVVAPAEPARLAMRLEDGDAVSFGLPGIPGLSLAFEHTGEGVRFATETLGTDYASN